MAVNATTVNAGCLPNGSATAIASNGSGTYQYAWSTAPVQTTATAAGLASGNYEVIVTDAVTGCQDSTTVFVAKTPGTLTANVLNADAVTCATSNNGTATVGVTGGVGALSYAWLPAGGNAATATNLAAGNYTVNVTDAANGCQTSVAVTVPAPPAINITLIGQTNSDCNTYGVATVVADGGTGILDYQWNTVPPQDSNVATGLVNGTYQVTVTDDNNCVSTQNVVVPGPASPVELAVVNTVDATACGVANGSITVIATGPGVTYQWQTTPVQTGPTLTGILPGPYTVTATGSNGCQDVLGITIGPVCPLYVEWIEFKAAAAETHIQLDWATREELNSAGFEVQRSLDATNFEAIGRVASLAPFSAGASYQWPDYQVEPGITYYYRLRHEDLDGGFSHTEIREARLDAPETASVLRVYPVPSSEWVYADMWLPEAGHAQLRLLNSLGQEVAVYASELQAGLTQYPIAISSLAEGVYLLQIRIGSQDVGVFRLIRE
ncbi:MAG: hypothetical protein EAZ89_18100 [Bacteroidetes bacterium]|nr:MAG: hypothetical protein EAZ89_18100 [Bacteroidota bacterium]